MVYRTGFLLQKDDIERYIQVETILAFYKQQFINTGKHLLFEDQTFIGNATFSDDHCILNGFNNFDQTEKKDIKAFFGNSNYSASEGACFHVRFRIADQR